MDFFGGGFAPAALAAQVAQQIAITTPGVAPATVADLNTKVGAFDPQTLINLGLAGIGFYGATEAPAGGAGSAAADAVNSENTGTQGGFDFNKFFSGSDPAALRPGEATNTQAYLSQGSGDDATPFVARALAFVGLEDTPTNRGFAYAGGGLSLAAVGWGIYKLFK